MRFIAYAFAKNLAHATISTYLAGVQHLFVTHNVRNAEVWTKRVKAALKGVATLRPAEPKRLPFVGSLVATSRQVATRLFGAVGEQVFTAICFGYFFLLRVGEFLGGPRTIRARDVSLGWNGAYLKLHELGRPLRGPAPDSVVVFLRFSKTDRLGKGASRMVSHDPGSEICICAALWRYASGSPAWRGEQVLFPDVSVNQVTTVMKASASSKGLDPDRVNTHSLRIGGLTQLSSKGTEKDWLRYAGRWSSESSIDTYFRPTEEVCARLSRSLADVDAVLPSGLAVLYPSRDVGVCRRLGSEFG